MNHLLQFISILSISSTLLCYRDGNEVIYDYLNLPEGSRCKWNGLNGVCASPYHCRTTMEDIRDERYPPVCSVQGAKVFICCTDCELGDITDSFRLDAGTPVWYYKTGEKARDHCLDYVALETKTPYRCYFVYDQYKTSYNITRNCFDVVHDDTPPGSGSGGVGGVPSNRDQYRHMALLGYGDNIDSAQWICGGSLISNKFILTAGHCTASALLGPVRYAALGILKRSDPLELWQRYLVKRIIPYPLYKPPSKYHDIALLETDTEVAYNKHVFPACLQFLANPRGDRWNLFAVATGWGALGHKRELADVMQAVYLDRYEAHECSQLYPKHRHLRHGYNHTTQMCYGNREIVRDTCEGDSGGPLQVESLVARCVYSIIGVTSTGKACGFTSNSGVYTRVIHYLPWIESIVWPD
ncbi:serine protease snake-like [Trichoplusia ni]|uniref:Serine protease snake-like n=1 Tax=Trichoplusia ni TaxID=7111 RepID=A0A7E5VKJ2_TRINI|nr:serine protease snake-like [Trichoplusia ni]